MRTASCVCVTLCLLASFALAADPRALSLAKEADKFYRENKYKEAAEKLSEAYAIEPAPLYLFNIARALDQAAEIERALERYRQYVGLSSELTTPELVKRANLAIDRLRTLVAKGEAEKQIRDSEKKRLESDAESARKNAADESAKAREERKRLEEKLKVQKVEATDSNQKRLVISLVVGGVGVASFGTAIATALTAAANRTKFREATTLADKQRLESETKTFAAVTDVCLLVGAAAAVTAIIIFPKEKPQEPSVSNLSFIPIRDGMMASVGGKF